MQTYRTIEPTAPELATLYEIQKSKFITHLQHVESEDEARAFVTAMKKQYYDARHNCSAWVLGADARLQKSNDDGEPGGTAGNPILEAIKQHALTDIVVVVTRYFGGIKLGAGGLIRAYSHSAVLGLEAARCVQMAPLPELRDSIGYSLLGTGENCLRGRGLSGGEPVYAADVTLPIRVAPAALSDLLTALTDLTSARFTYEKGDETLVPLPVSLKATE